ncbi:small GTP-binding protein [Syntrophobotulus glycolicus DSM 8271]|uniref:Ferrous iron transport protein B n=1 Tax=Syntrophobotulus glycolicus (strain DSM 8271 / FlGlyR) TaxID=645991 RepID=F0SV77_SYNGF|nr:ferrous iron transport protein B [Syntrophobotulus glycolicus]ADY55577.1 small GTP-binding protein [Syntrophobotulus glycolicus DSM 8271]
MSTAVATANRPLSIGLLGQPNTGKSTLFNALTGSRQHVGNWPGKTVEKKEGTLLQDGQKYKLVDLPGTYSLSANSDEEVITREYIASDDLDIVVAMIDASQLERSLFLLADYAGIDRPVAVLLNMMDVAREQGKSIDSAKLSALLGVPVFPVVASKKQGLEPLYALLKNAEFQHCFLRAEPLFKEYQAIFGDTFSVLEGLLDGVRFGVQTPRWIAAKLLENDARIKEMVREAVDSAAWHSIEQILAGVQDGLLTTADCKFRWINRLVVESAYTPSDHLKLNWFEHLATSPIAGKILALAVILGGLIAAREAGYVLMGLFSGYCIDPILGFVENVFGVIGIPAGFTTFFCETVLNGFIFAIMMALYIMCNALVFGLLEEVGYMARISYAFDNVMQRLGMQGKSVMPMLISFGCTMGGITGARVIDSWKQRTLTIASSWVVPCAATWGVLGLMSSLFFPRHANLIITALFLTSILHLFVTSKLFGRSLNIQKEQNGLIMELPPYHKPSWRSLSHFTLMRGRDVLLKALKVVIAIQIIFWLLSYSPDGIIANSIIYRIGTAIEPFTMIFGLNWQLFMSFVASAMGKEAAIGVIGSLFGSAGAAGNLFGLSFGGGEGGDFGAAILLGATAPQALAFMFAFYFNIPCFMAIATTVTETHSAKWTARIALYYVLAALLLSGVVYHISKLFF